MDWRGLGPTSTPEERFWSKVTLGDGCWTFDAYHDRDGYPVFWSGGRSVRAARFVFELLTRPLLAGECACHSCDNPACVNPGHIWAGTIADNNHDRGLKGRSRKPYIHQCRRCGAEYEQSRCPRCRAAYFKEYDAARRVRH